MQNPIYIPIVNSQDEIIGHGEKLEVHRLGQLHRAFSILVFNKKRQMLIHQRALHKYHSGGLWTNTCCGHPNEGEEMQAAVNRRLVEEMGFGCELEYAFKFQYKADFDNGLTESEIDHVYVGEYEGDFTVNPDEVADYKWVDMEDVLYDISIRPEKYTVWFKEIMKREEVENLV
jgi:isopentenyl-diphosphate Delta-isomerase